MDKLHYYLGFNLTPGIGPARLARLVAYAGSIEAAWNASPALLAASGLDAKSVKALLQTRAQLNLDHELRRVEQAGVQLLSIEDPLYPELLQAIPQPPPLIYVRGDISSYDAWALAVVGTRTPTAYGKEVVRRLSGALAEAGVTIISGLALGIDARAHAAALESGGRTIAVLAGGVDKPYPEQNRRLAEQVASSGALISEYPLGVNPLPNNFPARNRLISGLARGTLVVEAGAKSGALITVEFALEQGREVFAVPGEIYSRQSAGTHRLIRDGATLVSSVEDILEALNWLSATAQQEASITIPSDPTEAALFALIDYQPQHVDQLIRATGMPSPLVVSTLAILELKGAIRQTEGMHFVRMH